MNRRDCEQVSPFPRVMRPLLVVFALIGLATTATPVLAQHDNPSGFHVVAFSTGATMMSVDAVNRELTTRGFSALSNDGISYGVTGHYAFGRALLGIDVART